MRSLTAVRRGRLMMVLLILACRAQADSAGGKDVIARDSAGIEMIEITAPGWRAGQEWQVGSSPTLSIGEVEGDPNYLLSRIRGAQQLSGGRIVVADAGSNQIRFFDASGRHLQSVGGPGDGPGEFRYMGVMWRQPGDTLAITDVPGVTFIGPDGRFVRRTSLQMAEEKYRGNAAGQVATGEFLAMSGSRGFRWADAGTMIRDSLRFFWYRADGSFGGPLTVLPDAERWGLLAGGVVDFPYIPFATNPIWAAAGDRFYLAAGRSAELTSWRKDGKLERIIRWQRPARAVTSEMKEQLRTHLLASVRDANARRRQETFLAEAPIATELPGYQSLLIDEDENAWLEVYRPPWEVEPSWDVLTRDGRWLGTVRTPSGFRPMQIGRDFVLGVSRDELGVERIQSFALIRNPK